MSLGVEFEMPSQLGLTYCLSVSLGVEFKVPSQLGLTYCLSVSLGVEFKVAIVCWDQPVCHRV